MSRRIALIGLVLPVALGFGTLSAVAAPYPPPSEGSATVVPSRIRLGECATFSGDGFAARTTVAIFDNGAPDGSTTSSSDGTFSREVCPTVRGRHVISGQGQGADGQPLTVSAVLIVEGVRQEEPGGTTGGAGGQPGARPTATPVVDEPDEVSSPEPAPGPGGGVGASPDVKDDSGVGGLAAMLVAAVGTLSAALLLLLLGVRRRRKEEDELLDA